VQRLLVVAHVCAVGAFTNIRCRSQFQLAKAEVVDLFFTAYLHTWDRMRRTSIAQKIVDLMYLRPRHDLESAYLVIACVQLLQCQPPRRGMFRHGNSC
jgi:hypothetical protein